MIREPARRLAWLLAACLWAGSARGQERDPAAPATPAAALAPAPLTAPADPAPAPSNEASAPSDEAPAPPDEAQAPPDEAPAPPPGLDRVHRPDAALTPYRSRFDRLLERSLGQATRPVRYAWREDTVQLGINGGLPAELNNFNSLRAGGFARFPVAGLLLGLELSYVWVEPDESARRLALTPYRQPGRPPRLELDLTVAFPLAEGLVTFAPELLPAAQIVLQLHGDLRYLIYPGSLEGFRFVDGLRALGRGRISDRELANLEADRPAGMVIDRGRYHTLTGLGVDLYFVTGFFLSHRLLVAVPLLRGPTDSALGLGLELDLSLGVSF